MGTRYLYHVIIRQLRYRLFPEILPQGGPLRQGKKCGGRHYITIFCVCKVKRNIGVCVPPWWLVVPGVPFAARQAPPTARGCQAERGKRAPPQCGVLPGGGRRGSGRSRPGAPPPTREEPDAPEPTAPGRAPGRAPEPGQESRRTITTLFLYGPASPRGQPWSPPAGDQGQPKAGTRGRTRTRLRGKDGRCDRRREGHRTGRRHDTQSKSGSQTESAKEPL